MAQYCCLPQGSQSSSEKSKTLLCSFIFSNRSPHLRCYRFSCDKSFLFQSPPYMEMSPCALKGNSLPTGPQVNSHAEWAASQNVNSTATFSKSLRSDGQLDTGDPRSAACTWPLVQATLERVGWSLLCNRISHVEPDCVIHLRARWSVSIITTHRLLSEQHDLSEASEIIQVMTSRVWGHVSQPISRFWLNVMGRLIVRRVLRTRKTPKSKS